MSFKVSVEAKRRKKEEDNHDIVVLYKRYLKNKKSVQSLPKKILLLLEDLLVFIEGKNEGASRSECKSVVVVENEVLVGKKEKREETITKSPKTSNSEEVDMYTINSKINYNEEDTKKVLLESKKNITQEIQKGKGKKETSENQNRNQEGIASGVEQKKTKTRPKRNFTLWDIPNETSARQIRKNLSFYGQSLEEAKSNHNSGQNRIFKYQEYPIDTSKKRISYQKDRNMEREDLLKKQARDFKDKGR
ncbi:15975_t:CDS:2 [Gigaspora margarita]|uniref:15975_t:CDS:1 n=1 Tax=Gigaspora margarita TaxID=4874 RepID=A0ABN7VN76_GIGMA|nr:15975_t:CDS:2 [Gigaspora margarita]